MRIERAETLQEMLQCIPVEQQMRKREKEIVPLKDYLLFVALNAENPMFGMWFGYDDENNIIGYAVAMMIPIVGMQSIWIIRVWYDPKYKELPNKYIKLLRKWGRENGIKKFTIAVNRGIKAFQRKWGFKVISVNMERRIY